MWRMYLVRVAALSLLASAVSLPPPPGWVPRIGSSLRYLAECRAAPAA